MNNQRLKCEKMKCYKNFFIAFVILTYKLINFYMNDIDESINK